jgi:hypothetical protein
MMIFLTFALISKHFIVDFPLQGPYQYKNKGTYGHPGGILHAGLHGLATFGIIVWLSPILAAFIALVEAIAHYHIDWAKMNLNARMAWRPDNSEYFWWLLGLDQWLHYCCYVLIVWLAT